MKIEHFALNVEDPLAMSHWYTQHLGMHVVRQLDVAPFTTFLSDDSGRTLLEIYKKPAENVPVYKQMDPLQLHLAFVSFQPKEDAERLVKAGASWEKEDQFADGTLLVMLRDPWGLALQLCKRAFPLLTEAEIKPFFS
ncbi:VOC family protein [Rhodocytophaga aerolata]|uniref:VOC family protein n=1 Tax=Rhodocytophaga aerolata TaxID=455078 RepID=A0ABT8RAB3_9BACT|nr:VOC family protein [Rhodocytophaga aerolata]MDO1449039.1 VOC family protein [Rhodocytophaga aerolata]